MPREDREVFFDDADALKETAMALLVDIDGGEYWVPKSQITEESEVQHEGDMGTLVVTRWWAEKEGLA